MADRRKTMWKFTGVQRGIEVGTAGERIALDGSLSVADSQGLTLTRLIADLSFMSNTVAGAWGVQRFAMGVGMASREAYTAESLPSPNSDVEEPARGWIYQNIIAVSQNGVGGVVTTRVLFDLRAQRRLDSGRMFFKFVNSDLFGTSASIHVVGMVRALFLLP